MVVNDNMNGRQVRNLAPNLPIVGIGASAGGVEALEQFFKSVPTDHGLAFVIVTHLSPDRESMLSEILGRAARMPVVDARDGERVAACSAACRCSRRPSSMNMPSGWNNSQRKSTRYFATC